MFKFKDDVDQRNWVERVKKWGLIWSPALIGFVCGCVEFLQPSQPNGVMSSTVS